MTLHVPRLDITVDPLIAEAKQRARRRRFNLACVLAAGTLLALGLSLPARPGTFAPAVVGPETAGAAVTSMNASGYIGPLRLDRSSVADIRRFAGKPDFEGTGSFDAARAGTPAAYLALGYGCSPTHSSTGVDPGGARPAHLYCSTVYYLNARTHALAGIWTDSPTFRTSAGTRPGMSEQTANRLEGSAFGIVRTTGAGSLALAYGSGRVTALVFESRIHPVGLLFD